MRAPSFPGFRRGFSLAEVLVAVTVVGLLAALGMAGLARGQAKVLESRCLANMHTWIVATGFYAGDNNGRLPITAYVGKLDGHNYSHNALDDLIPYTGIPNRNKVDGYGCTKPGWTFGFNSYVSALSSATVPAARLAFIIDIKGTSRWVTQSVLAGASPAILREAVPRPHSGRVNLMFLDGHGQTAYLSELTVGQFTVGTPSYVEGDEKRYIGTAGFDY